MRREPTNFWFGRTFDAGRKCGHPTTSLVHDDNGDRRLVCKECGRTVMHRRAGAFKP